jgi:hypothetical protein
LYAPAGRGPLPGFGAPASVNQATAGLPMMLLTAQPCAVGSRAIPAGSPSDGSWMKTSSGGRGLSTPSGPQAARGVPSRWWSRFSRDGSPPAWRRGTPRSSLASRPAGPVRCAENAIGVALGRMQYERDSRSVAAGG